MRRIIGIGSVPERRPFMGPGYSPLTNQLSCRHFLRLPLNSPESRVLFFP